MTFDKISRSILSWGSHDEDDSVPRALRARFKLFGEVPGVTACPDELNQLPTELHCVRGS